MENIINLLTKYGLSERHAKVYLYLLEKMEDTVLEISRALNIPRTTTYSILNELKQQSLTPLLIQQEFIKKWDGRTPLYGNSPIVFKNVN